MSQPQFHGNGQVSLPDQSCSIPPSPDINDGSKAGPGGATAPPFDPASLRLSQDYIALNGVKKILSTVPVRKPLRQEFVRVHPEADFALETYVLDLKEERDVYLVTQELWPVLPGELTPVVLLTAVNRQGVT